MQHMFLLEKAATVGRLGRAPLDRDAIAASRNFVKGLVRDSPPNVAWVVTVSHCSKSSRGLMSTWCCRVTGFVAFLSIVVQGSAMAILWANLVEAPTNGALFGKSGDGAYVAYGALLALMLFNVYVHYVYHVHVIIALAPRL